MCIHEEHRVCVCVFVRYESLTMCVRVSVCVKEMRVDGC